MAELTGTHPLAESYYANVVPPFATSALQDQQTGAAIMWFIGDLIGLSAGFVIAQQWWRQRKNFLRPTLTRAGPPNLATMPNGDV